MAYFPTYEVRMWPAAAGLVIPVGAGTKVNILGGRLTRDRFESSAEFTFDLPLAWNHADTDYTAALLHRGAWIEVTTATDGNLAGATARKRFLGKVRTWGRSRGPGGEVAMKVTCYDLMANIRSTGSNVSKATPTKRWESTFTAAEFSLDPDHAGYLVELGGTAADNGEEWMPGGLIYVASTRTNADPDNEILTEVIEKEGREFDGNNKRIYFSGAQASRITTVNSTSDVIVNYSLDLEVGDNVQVFHAGALHAVTVATKNDTTKQVTFAPAVPGLAIGDLIYPDRTYTFRVHYFDPADLTATVNKALEEMFTGSPWSYRGGMGWLLANVNLATIVGFDGVTPKRVRSILQEKVDGPNLQLLDAIRDSGLVPRRYWIRHDPITRKIEGSYVSQANGAVIDLYGSEANTDDPCTLEGVAGKVEMYSPALTPQNFALGKTVTATVPGGYSTEGDVQNLVDGRGDTPYIIYKKVTTVDYDPVGAPVALQLDLGEAREDVRRVQIRGSKAQTLDGNGKWIDYPIYFISRLPKLTVYASESPIDAANPGTPISPDGISVQYDPTDVGANNGIDIDIELVNIWRCRYIAITFEQDFFARVDGNNIGATARISMFALSEIKVLGDGRFRYKTGPDKGLVPYAQITRRDTTVGAAPPPTPNSFTVADASWITPGMWIQVMVGGTPIQTKVLGVGGLLLTVEQPVIGIGAGDHVGEHFRWRMLLNGVWQDFYFPGLYERIVGATDWTEPLQDDRAAYIEEAEALAAERLLESIGVTRDHRVTIGLTNDAGCGVTVSTHPGEQPWLVDRETFIFHSADPEQMRDDSPPLVVMELAGTNYDEAAA